MTSQLALTEPVEVPEHRIRALAGVLAGFGWPDRGTFEALTKPQKRLALDAARLALRYLAKDLLCEVCWEPLDERPWQLGLDGRGGAHFDCLPDPEAE